MLGDVGEFVRGGGMSKADLSRLRGLVRSTTGRSTTVYGDYGLPRPSRTWLPTVAHAQAQDRRNQAILSSPRPARTIKAVGKAVAWIGDSDVAVSGDAYIFRHTLDPRYVSYFFQSDRLSGDRNGATISGTKVRRISGAI